MGRKIPGKKHRTVKDPYEQQARRFDKIRNKVNQRPREADDQEVPKCIKNIANFKNEGFQGKFKNKKNKYKSNKLLDSSKFVNLEDDQPGMTRPLKMIPRLVQNPKESDEKFLYRVNSATKSMLKEAEYEDKFNVEVTRDEWGNVVDMKKREQIDPLAKHDDKDSKKQLERAEKRKQKNKEREMKKKIKKSEVNSDSDNDFDYLKDKIEFGEVVHEPPKLETHKLAKKVKNNDNKSNMDGFLFMKTLKGESNSKSKGNGNVNKLKLSMSQQRQLEEERERVVAAYRELKKNKKHKIPAPY